MSIYIIYIYDYTFICIHIYTHIYTQTHTHTFWRCYFLCIMHHEHDWSMPYFEDSNKHSWWDRFASCSNWMLSHTLLGLKSYSKLKWGLWVGSWPSLHWGVHKRPNPSPLGSSKKKYPPPTPPLSHKFVKRTLKWLKTASRILEIGIYLSYRYCVCIENFKS